LLKYTILKNKTSSFKFNYTQIGVDMLTSIVWGMGCGVWGVGFGVWGVRNGR